MMNIGFYAKRAAQNRTGLGNYSRFVIRILSEQFVSNSYHLYTPKPHRMPYLGEIPTLKKLSLHFPPKGIWSKIRSIWRVWGRPTTSSRMASTSSMASATNCRSTSAHPNNVRQSWEKTDANT